MNGPLQSGAAEVQSNGVPWSLILESIDNLKRGMAKQLVSQAIDYGIVDPEEQEGYLQGLINLDREKLKTLFK
jgi:hypothetical protein